MPPVPQTQTIFSQLPGTWTVSRDLGAMGRFEGTARFWAAEPDRENCLRYREDGVMIRSDGQRFDGFREYDFVLEEDGAMALLFRDPVGFGNLYVRLRFDEKGQPDDLAAINGASGPNQKPSNLSASDIHYCGDDIYHHAMIWHDCNHFETKIKVVGPRKNTLLHTVYRRAD